MARYDRIAPLSPPSRENAFPCWPVLRDVEANDRDLELARRARLRFLALRPARRLLDSGLSAVGRASYLAQIEAVRQELGYLPARDAERARLGRFLHHIEEPEPARVIAAVIEMAIASVGAAQLYGAEEYALTALGLAVAASEERLQAAATVVLARVAAARGLREDVRESSDKAAALALSVGDLTGYVQAQAEHALDAAAHGEATAAREILKETLKRVRVVRDVQAEALVQARMCACEIALGNAAVALDHGWAGLRQLDDLRERAQLLEQIGIAFSRLGLHKAADRCFTMLAQRGIDSALRTRARAAQAVEAAAVANAQLFRERRTALLNDAAEWSADPRLFSFTHLEIGRGALMSGDVDDAREHLHAAIGAARRHNLKDLVAGVEEILTALEHDAIQELITSTGSGPAADAARRIAEQLDAIPDLPVIAG